MKQASAQPNDLTVKAERVLRLCDEMNRLLDDEMDLLTTRANADYGNFIKKKQQLLLDYQGAVKSLLSRKEEFSLLSPPLRAQLRTAGSKLDTIARQNSEKLSVTAAATHKVLQVIIDAVRRESTSTQPQSYNPAQFHSYRDDRAPRGPAVLLTEKA